MPGIVGLITRAPRARAERELLKMVEALRHGSSYVGGTWIDESLGVYVGSMAIKGSFSDGMPLHNDAGTKHLVFSGEEFSDPSTFSSGQAGKAASYIMALCEQDSEFPSALNGRFHGLSIDQRRKQASLFNDR